MKQFIDDEAIEQTLAELAAHLVEAEDVLVPSLEAKVRDVRAALKRAYHTLSRLEVRVTRRKATS